MLHWLANKVGNGTFVFPKYYQVGREGGREGGRGRDEKAAVSLVSVHIQLIS